jgi:hypothetical protein
MIFIEKCAHVDRRKGFAMCSERRYFERLVIDAVRSDPALIRLAALRRSQLRQFATRIFEIAA